MIDDASPVESLEYSATAVDCEKDADVADDDDALAATAAAAAALAEYESV